MKERAIVVHREGGSNIWASLCPQRIDSLFVPINFRTLRKLSQKEEVKMDLYVMVPEYPGSAELGFTKAEVRRVKEGSHGCLEVQYVAGHFSGYQVIFFWSAPVFFKARDTVLADSVMLDLFDELGSPKRLLC